MTPSRFPKPLLAWVVTIFALGVVAVVLWAVAPDYATARAGRADSGYLESGDCRKCHETNYRSWQTTFHRTMTQEAGLQSVLGDFEHNNTITYQGVRAEMVRENGRYWMNVTGVDGVTQKLEIVRTVGSRRIQRYLTKTGDTWFRLPVAYDLVQRRWMHLNGSFFFPDGSDYKQHVAEWNANCVFCHNVKAQPGLDWDKRTWQTEVTELGIACGALPRTRGRACATRSFATDALSLAIARPGRNASTGDEPGAARLRSFGDGVRSLPRPASAVTAAAHPDDDERGRSVPIRAKIFTTFTSRCSGTTKWRTLVLRRVSGQTVRLA